MLKVGDKVWVTVSRDKERPGIIKELTPLQEGGKAYLVARDGIVGTTIYFDSELRLFGSAEIKVTKNDDKKCRLELIPPEAIISLGDAFTFGAKKYSADNWANGFEWRRLIGAAQRHINSFNAGEDKDPESGLSHIDHALACLAMLVAHEKGELGEDDRRKV